MAEFCTGFVELGFKVVSTVIVLPPEIPPRVLPKITSPSVSEMTPKLLSST